MTAGCEIATTPDLTERMCRLVEPALSDPTKKVLEPGCGSGTFLVAALRRRLAAHSTAPEILLALSNLYGIDILPAAIEHARANLRQLIATQVTQTDYRFWPLVETFLEHNLIIGDFLQPETLTLIDWRPTAPYQFAPHPTTLAAILKEARA